MLLTYMTLVRSSIFSYTNKHVHRPVGSDTINFVGETAVDKVEVSLHWELQQQSTSRFNVRQNGAALINTHTENSFTDIIQLILPIKN